MSSARAVCDTVGQARKQYAKPGKTGVFEFAREAAGGLFVGREGIRFYNVRPDLVRIEVELHNRGREPSAPAKVVLQAAPLGAFVPWQPLAALNAPPLEPGGRATLTFDAPDPNGSRSPAAIVPSLFRRPRTTGRLPVDILREWCLGSVHWAGNINVFVGGRTWERHGALALRIYPGLTNVAMFCVGDGRPDEYQFSLSGEPWDADLYLMSHPVPSFRALGRPSLDHDRRILPGDWVPIHHSLVFLAAEVPAACEAGKINVHARQRRTDREAIVEFDLDPSAKGPGCYKL